MGRTRLGLFVAAMAVVFAGCGGGDDSDDGGGGGGGGSEDGSYFDDAIPGVYSNNGLVDYEVTDDSISIELDDGSKNDPNACTSTTSLDPEEVGDRTITLVYPDGEVDCTDA